MKIIFLDIDGVLNFPGCKVFHPSGYLGVVPEKLELINQLVERTGARVIISSTWRRHFDSAQLQCYLNKQGARFLISGYTPHHGGPRPYRGDEVNEWLGTQPMVTHHVIFDDDGDFHATQPLIQTDCLTGITREDMERAVEVLS